MADDIALKALYETTIRQYEFTPGWQQSREFGLDIMRQAYALGRGEAELRFWHREAAKSHGALPEQQ